MQAVEMLAEKIRHKGIMNVLDGVVISLEYAEHAHLVGIAVPAGVVNIWLARKVFEGTEGAVPVLCGRNREGKLSYKKLDDGGAAVNVQFHEWGTLWEPGFVQDGVEGLIWVPPGRRYETETTRWSTLDSSKDAEEDGTASSVGTTTGSGDL